MRRVRVISTVADSFVLTSICMNDTYQMISFNIQDSISYLVCYQLMIFIFDQK